MKQRLQMLAGARTAPERIRPGGAHDAAVVIPLFFKGDEYHVLFEVRQRGIRQGGEICFPGGRIEDGETAREAAVREVSEELLISPDGCRMIAPLHQLIGPGEVLVTSYLAELQGYTGTFSKNEVDHVFTLPLRFFFEHEPERYDAETKIALPEDFPYSRIPNGKNYAWRKMPHPIWFYETEEGTIWGFTAQVMYLAAPILKKFLEL